ncbi:MAG: hypothetical protein AB7D46_06600, partial [Flavobacteriaceae bacterium]
ILDFNLLILRLIFNFSKSYNFVYTGEGICLKVQGQYRDRILENLALENIIYINRGRDTIIKSINGIKTYNIGGMVKLLTFVLKFTNKKRFSTYYAFKIVNNSILKFATKPKVYSLLYYNLNGLSLVFSKQRCKIQLIEVQHGAIINFPAYSEPSEIKIADIFYVKNQGTINYLKERLNKNFKDIEYRMLPYPKRKTEYKKGKHILYASTIEFNGIHPVFMEYLTELTQDDKVTVYVRLHPREKNKKEVFENQLKNIKSNIIFDESKNWLESNTVKNLIVVSPWSSVIEDAADNGHKAIIIEEMGKQRFNYLIDNENVFYSNNLKETFKRIL